MANEISIVSKTSCVTALGAYTPSQTITKTLTQTGTNVGSFTQDITTSDAIIDIPGSVTGNRWVEINALNANTDTHYITISIGTGGSFSAGVCGMIPPAGVVTVMIPSGVNWYLKTDSGTIKVDVRCFQQ